MHYGDGMMKEEIRRARRRAGAASPRGSGFRYSSPLGAGFGFDGGRPTREQINPYSRRGKRQHDHIADGGVEVEYEEACIEMGVRGGLCPRRGALGGQRGGRRASWRGDEGQEDGENEGEGGREPVQVGHGDGTAEGGRRRLGGVERLGVLDHVKGAKRPSKGCTASRLLNLQSSGPKKRNTRPLQK